MHEIQKRDEQIVEVLKANSELIKSLSAQVQELEPDALAFRAITASGKGFTASDAAQMLSRHTGYSIGRNKLFDYLRDCGIMQPSRNHVYQNYVDAGYFENNLIDAGPHLRSSIKITGTGLEYLSKKIIANPEGLKPLTDAQLL